MQTITQPTTSAADGRGTIVPTDAERDTCDVGPLNVNAMAFYVTKILAVTWGLQLEKLSRWQQIKFWLYQWFWPKSRREKARVTRNRQLLETELWKGLPEEWHVERVRQLWMPLSVYVIVERNLARILGSPDQLFEAGLIAGQSSRFGAVWIGRIFTAVRVVLRIFCTVTLLFSEIIPRFLYSKFNRNKTLTCLEASWKRVKLRTQYCWVNEQTKQRRHPLDDIFSYLWWATGMCSSAALFWGVRTVVKHELVQVNLYAFLLRLKQYGFMQEEVKQTEDGIVVGGQLVAIPTYFQREKEQPFFTVATNQPAGRLTRYGHLVMGDIVVHTQPSELYPTPIEWTVLADGTYCCPDAGCAISSYEFSIPWLNPFYWLSWLFSSLSFSLVIRLVVGAFAALTTRMDERVAQEQENLNFLAEKEKADRNARFLFASPASQRAAEQGIEQELILERPVALCVDLAGSTRRTRRFGNEAIRPLIKAFYRVILQTILPYELSRRDKRNDEVVALWGGSAGDSAMLQFVGGTSSERLHAALCVANELHSKIGAIVDPAGEPFEIRIGIARLGDSALWSLEEAPFLFMGGGSANMNEAARLQELAKRDEFDHPPRPTVLREELAHEVCDRWDFVLLGKNVQVRDITTDERVKPGAERGRSDQDQTLAVSRESGLTLVRMVGPKHTEG